MLTTTEPRNILDGASRILQEQNSRERQENSEWLDEVHSKYVAVLRRMLDETSTAADEAFLADVIADEFVTAITSLEQVSDDCRSLKKALRHAEFVGQSEAAAAQRRKCNAELKAFKKEAEARLRELERACSQADCRVWDCIHAPFELTQIRNCRPHLFPVTAADPPLPFQPSADMQTADANDSTG